VDKKKLGKTGEILALSFLKNLGYTILERNYRTKCGEIDIIARDKNEIAFIEVKTRSSDIFGLPQEAVNRKKISKIEKTSIIYLEKNKISTSTPIRYEVLSIIKNNNNCIFKIIPIE
jgi:putative endonuclease